MMLRHTDQSVVFTTLLDVFQVLLVFYKSEINRLSSNNVSQCPESLEIIETGTLILKCTKSLINQSITLNKYRKRYSFIQFIGGWNSEVSFRVPADKSELSEQPMYALNAFLSLAMESI